MFSFGNPFVHDFVRPKSSIFDDDFMSLPFSNSYYQNEQPSLFRSSSFRQPNRSSFYQPTYQQHTSDEENDYELDPFSDFFNLRKRPSNLNERRIEKENNEDRKIENVNNDERKSIESKNDNVDKIKSNIRQPKNLSELRQLKSLKSSSISHQNKELDALRIDNDNEIEFRFNYKCNNPSDINICIRKDGYIELKTIDSYKWLQRIPDNVMIDKASCTFKDNQLSLKLPIKKSTSQINVQDDHNKVNDKKDDKNVINQSQNNNQQLKDNKKEVDEDQSQNNSQQLKDDIDPDAPIVTPIYEDDDY